VGDPGQLGLALLSEIKSTTRDFRQLRSLPESIGLDHFIPCSMSSTRMWNSAVDVSLTPKGRARFEAIWPEHEEGIRQYFSEPLSDSDVISLRSVLAKLISANANRHTAAF
jgi:hypothetical protein